MSSRYGSRSSCETIGTRARNDVSSRGDPNRLRYVVWAFVASTVSSQGPLVGGGSAPARSSQRLAGTNAFPEQSQGEWLHVVLLHLAETDELVPALESGI